MALVISASRRTDLAGCYPDAFIDRLKEYPPDKVHTLVIWTKNPVPLLRNKRLRDAVAGYKQIFIHLTVTGMGGSEFEPHIPASKDIIDRLPGLVELTGESRRIAWRFDPIVHFKKGRKKYSNLSFFKTLAPLFARHEISLIKTSWASPYKKVIRNLKSIGWEIEDISLEQKKKEAAILEAVAQKNNQRIEYCCSEGFPISRCIDGFLFNELYPAEDACSIKKAKGQRALCGCTESIDIGWYAQQCGHGCVYCYANPRVTSSD